MGDYIKQCLKPIMGDDISDDIIDYILTIKHEEDYAEFMENIVDMNNPEHLKVYETLKREQFGTPSRKNKGPKEFRDSKVPFQTLNTIEDSQKSSRNAGGTSSGKGKKQKFVNFYTQDHKPGLRKGRHPCNCQATKHNLINNCTKCGRIVCEQEGSGPCFFCDNMVCTRLEMEVLQLNSKESDKLYNHLIEKKKSGEWKRAIETRNRLITSDKLGGDIKNKVYDDQNDYFEMNSQWLSDSEKKTLKKRHTNVYNRLHKSRRDLKLALDFASRTVTVENEQPKYKDNLMKGVNKLLDNTERRFPKNLFEGDKGELIAEIVKLMEEQKINTENLEKDDAKKLKPVTQVKKLRIANDEFLESVDQGLCLSMHQPWASLLVAGIKLHEGRTWRTDHKGRLWIAAAAKEPEDDEILACEQMYRELYNDSSLEFPKKYPTGCLLGCVFLEDCMDQTEYRKKYPNGESSSPYVFICSNPVILPIFYPMQGQHKIFPLNKELHKTAKAALMSAKWL